MWPFYSLSPHLLQLQRSMHNQHSLVILSRSNSRGAVNDGYSLLEYQQDTHADCHKYCIIVLLRLMLDYETHSKITITGHAISSLGLSVCAVPVWCNLTVFRNPPSLVTLAKLTGTSWKSPDIKMWWYVVYSYLNPYHPYYRGILYWLVFSWCSSDATWKLWHGRLF
jgi:hypothetical protein